MRFAALTDKLNTATVLGLTQKGHVYRFTLSAHRGLSIEQVFSNPVSELVVASHFEVDSACALIIYGTEDGAVKTLEMSRDSSIVQQTVEMPVSGAKASSVLATAGYLYATLKNGTFLVKSRKNAKSAALCVPNSTAHESQAEESKFGGR